MSFGKNNGRQAVGGQPPYAPQGAGVGQTLNQIAAASGRPQVVSSPANQAAYRAAITSFAPVTATPPHGAGVGQTLNQIAAASGRPIVTSSPANQAAYAAALDSISPVSAPPAASPPPQPVYTADPTPLTSGGGDPSFSLQTLGLHDPPAAAMPPMPTPSAAPSFGQPGGVPYDGVNLPQYGGAPAASATAPPQPAQPSAQQNRFGALRQRPGFNTY